MAIRRVQGVLIMFSIVFGIAITPAFGQRKIKSRMIEFGAGPSLVAIYDNSSLTDNYPKLSGAASGGLIYAVQRNLSVTAHIMYERKGGNVTVQSPDIEASDVDFNITSSYMTLAPGIRQYFGNSSVFIEGGPFISFLFYSNTKRNSSGLETNLGNQFTTVDVGFSGSIGVTPMRRQSRGLNFRLVNNLGLADINHTTGVKDWTNSLSLIVGMRIKMR